MIISHVWLIILKFYKIVINLLVAEERVDNGKVNSDKAFGSHHSHHRFGIARVDISHRVCGWYNGPFVSRVVFACSGLQDVI